MRTEVIVMLLLLAIVPIIMIPSYAEDLPENLVATIETKSGNIMMEFFPDVAPNHVDNFIKLSKSGYYDGTVFHRVIKSFMIQGGDPNTKDPNSIPIWGTGGPGYSIDAEFNDYRHERGIVSMARSNDPNSAGSQFFIVHGNASFLDGQYTVFGRILGDASFATLDKIANMETLPGDRPVNWQDTEIISITFENKGTTSTEESSEVMPGDDKNDAGGCLIATATFGSELAPQVQSLREFRNNVVMETESGRVFMTWFNSIYYVFSPSIADLEREDPIIREIVKGTITPMITLVSLLEYADIDSNEKMITYGMLVILLNIIIYVGLPLTALYILKQQLSHMKHNKKSIRV